MCFGRVAVFLLCSGVATGIKIGQDSVDAEEGPVNAKQEAWLKKQQKNHTARVELARTEASAFKHEEELQRQHFDDEMRPERAREEATEAMAEAALEQEAAAFAGARRESSNGMEEKKKRLMDAVLDGQQTARKEEEQRIQRQRAEFELSARQADRANVDSRLTSKQIEANEAAKVAATAAKEAQEAAKLQAAEDLKKKAEDQRMQAEAAAKKFAKSEKAAEAKDEHLAKLDQRARAMRLEVQRGVTSGAQDPMEGLGDISMADLMDTLTQLNTGLQEQALVSAFDNAIHTMKASSSKFLKTANSNLDSLTTASKLPDATPERLLPLTAEHFVDTNELLKSHARELNTSWNTLQKAMSSELKSSISVLAGMMGGGAADMPVNDSLANASLEEGCSQLSVIMDWVRDCDKNMTKSLETLNSTAKMLPMLSSMMPELSQQLTTTLTDLIDFGYVESAAMKEVAEADMTQVSPILTNNMRCTLQSAAVRTSRGLLAALAAFAVALFYF